jgi:acyl carrier protein
MLQQTTPVSEFRLVRLVESILSRTLSGESSRRRQISVDGDLLEIGMTSVDMVNLMLAVEAEFDVMIPSGDITPENFRSIAAIDALVSRLDGSGASPA